MDDDPWADAQSPRSGTPTALSPRPSGEVVGESPLVRSSKDGDLGSPSADLVRVSLSSLEPAKGEGRSIPPSPSKLVSPSEPASSLPKNAGFDDIPLDNHLSDPFASDPFSTDPYAGPFSSKAFSPRDSPSTSPKRAADPFTTSPSKRAASPDPFAADADEHEFFSPMPSAIEAFGSPLKPADDSGAALSQSASPKDDTPSSHNAPGAFDANASPAAKALASDFSPPANDFSPHVMDDLAAAPANDFDDLAAAPANDFDDLAAAPANDFDDFDDFDDPAPADFGGDEFGDFGDFGDADVAPMPAAPAPVPAPVEVRWSTLSLRPVPPRLELLQRLMGVLEPLVPNHSDFTDEPPRAVGGLSQVLTSESSRDVYAQLTTAPILKPLDWTRSRVRREHLIAMGVPVNLDEVDSHRLSALPPLRITTADMPARSQSAAPAPQKRHSLPPPGPATAGASAPVSARNSHVDKYDLGPRPVLDTARAEELCGLEEEQLALLTLSKLQALQAELEQTTASASGLLAYLLQLKDALGTDSRTYNGMISELIANAAKQKAPSSGLFRRSTGPRSRPTSMSATPRRVGSPDGYAANVKWWGDAISASLKAGYLGDTLVLHPSQLPDKFANGTQRPRGLVGVLDALTPATLLPLARYDAQTMPIDAAPSLGSRVAGGVLGAGWAVLGRLSPFSSSGPSEEQLWKATSDDLVHLPSIRSAAAAWIAHITANPPLNYTDSVFSRASFTLEFKDIMSTPLSTADMNILLRWLERDARRIVVDGDIIKIGTGQVSEADRGAVAVSDALERVESQVVAAEKEAETCTVKARAKVASGQRSAAAAYLRSRKGLDDVVAKRVAAGEQLRSVRRALNQAKDDAEMISVYEASTAALASALSDPRLSPERIAATTDALADALADQREIDDAVRLAGVAVAPDVDDDELAAELEALVIDEKKRLEVEAKERARAEAEAKVRAEAAAKEKAEKEAKEAKEKVEREAREKAEKAEKERIAKEKAKEAAEEAEKPSNTSLANADWARRYDEAQAREIAEKARFEEERLAREARMMPAE
ncbi:hypothetical protein CcaverHIS641_0401160 [Cutaneotrichosporon cavernicola]|nr:hypothetical protein CcaverHIS641_0401160 [Cutaneotrichosporon cavernicola]